MRRTTDGFPIDDSISFLDDVYPGLNEWSKGRTISVEVEDFFMNPRTVNWAGKNMWVADYDLFMMMVKDWMSGTKLNPGMTKKEALNLMFDIRS